MTSRFDSPAILAAACARKSRRLDTFRFACMTASVLTYYRTRDFK
jgi:hypothetical protein